jgi:hypothetical protein
MYGRHAIDMKDAINTDTKKKLIGAEKKNLVGFVT